jgi:hypothetical protein
MTVVRMTWRGLTTPAVAGPFDWRVRPTLMIRNGERTKFTTRAGSEFLWIVNRDEFSQHLAMGDGAEWPLPFGAL